MQDIEEKIYNILSQRKTGVINDKKWLRAAVLLPLYRKKQEDYLLFTKRSEKVKYHKGQISFPGGAFDEGDKTLKATVLRESFEEMGIKPADVRILGSLDDIVTLSSNFIVTPFVGAIPYPYKFEINRDEIEEMIEVPLSAIIDRENYKEDFWVHEGKIFPSYFYQYQNHLIWGATARILKQFIDLVFAEKEKTGK